MKYLITGLGLALTPPVMAQMAPPISIIQTTQTGSITEGTSGAAKPRLDQSKPPAEAEAADAKAKAAELDKPAAGK